MGENGSGDLLSLPTGKKVIGCCWLFMVKVNLNGSVARLKAYLVVEQEGDPMG